MSSVSHRMRWVLLLGLGAGALLIAWRVAWAGPDGGPSGREGTMGAGGAGAVATSPTSLAATNKRLAALRKKVLKDEDFVENDETNRDPFHSYLRLFADHTVTKNRKVPAIFDRAGLEELTLIAIVSGDDNPRAMFRDATGFGQSVAKGDFLSRSGARVTKILSDRVVVEISEVRESGEPRIVERAILVNPGESP